MAYICKFVYSIRVDLMEIQAMETDRHRRLELGIDFI